MIRHEHSNGPPPTQEWPGWHYGPDGEAEIFECAEDVPEGWTSSPGEPPEVFVPRHSEVLNQDELMAALRILKVEINPLWGVAHMKKVLDDLSSAR